MGSAAYSEDLTCPVCRTIFADPVTLLCGHSVCIECIAGGPSSQCTQCERAVPTLCDLPTSLTLKRLAEKAKEAEKMKKENGSDREEASKLCPEHEEKLKLFCVTDQQLACIICRDAERHDGHKFKPVKEAAASLRRELEGGMEGLRSDIAATESLAHTQRAEMTKTQENSQQLATQIRRQFEEMHQFLRKREDGVKNELRCKEEDAVERMRESLDAMETALSQSRELEEELTSVLQIEDSEGLLRSWTEGKSRAAPECLFRPRANDLQVVNTSLSLGPYESHLQFFVWKEMLQVIQPRAELLSLKTNSADITVSDDGRSLFCTPKSEQAPSGYSSGTKVNGQYRGFGFAKEPADIAFNYGSAAGSDQARAFGFGQKPAQNIAFNRGSAAGSDQARAFGFGQKPAQNIPFNRGSAAESDQARAFGFGQKPAQNIPFNHGSAAGSDQARAFGFGQKPAQNIPFNRGSAAESDQSRRFKFGANKEPGKNEALDPAWFAGLAQTAASSIITNVFSVNEFTSGQHYWETEVGHRDYWALGIKDHFLNYDGQKYSTCSPKTTTELALGARPRKIGIYLNCSSKKLSFYDADNMTHIHTLSSGLMSTPLSAHFKIRVTAPDRNPLTVCWY